MVELKLDVLLLRGTTLKLNQEAHWVDFKYEQLPSFCFYCGLIGHQERLCDTKLFDSNTNNICEDQYGSWLRTSIPKGDKKKTNGGSEMGTQVVVREIPSQLGRIRAGVRGEGKLEGERNQPNASKTKMTVLDQPHLQEFKESTG